MCSFQSASDVNFDIYSSEQLEDDFITNLLTQNISNDFQNPEALLHKNHENQNVGQTDDTSRFSYQMDHDYIATESSTLLSPSWEEGSTSSLSMSTYFSTFDPSVQFETNQQLPVMRNKVSQAMGKLQRTRINLVPSTAGNLKAAVKRKRKRTVFRTEQVEVLEKVFAKKPYVTKEERQVLVEKLNICDKSIKVWFQNRRLKNKRDEDQSMDDENFAPSLDRLDYVESKINERTNAFGYVTLDDGIMRDLVQVIEEYLKESKSDRNEEKEYVEMGEIPAQCTINAENPVYEPISPASTTDSSYEESSWECHYPERNEHLQILIDIDSIISK